MIIIAKLKVNRKHRCLECGELLIRKNNSGKYYCKTPREKCSANDYKVTKKGKVILMNRTGIDQPSTRKNRMAYEERWNMTLKGDPIK